MVSYNNKKCSGVWSNRVMLLRSKMVPSKGSQIALNEKRKSTNELFA